MDGLCVKSDTSSPYPRSLSCIIFPLLACLDLLFYPSLKVPLTMSRLITPTTFPILNFRRNSRGSREKVM